MVKTSKFLTTIMFNNPVQVEADAKNAANAANADQGERPVATPARAPTPCPTAFAQSGDNASLPGVSWCTSFVSYFVLILLK